MSYTAPDKYYIKISSIYSASVQHFLLKKINQKLKIFKFLFTIRVFNLFSALHMQKVHPKGSWQPARLNVFLQ